MTKKIIETKGDVVGETNLRTIADADKFNRWMYETIKPFCRSNVFEIGSGIGNISRFFLNDGYKIQLTDLRKEYCENLNRKLASEPNVIGVERMDIVDENFDQKYVSHFNKYHTVFALNVVEHIENDLLALNNAYKLLKKGGKLIILVPAYQFLFNRFDKELGHYRRYTSTSLQKIFSEAKFKVVHQQYFNLTGIFGWFFSGKILNKKTIPKGQMNIYNKLVPVFKIIDKMTLNNMGLSVIVVGEK